MNIRIDKTSMICITVICSVYIVSNELGWIEKFFRLAGSLGMELIL
jgi:hypothetical protein